LLKRTFGEEWKAPTPTLATPVRSWQYWLMIFFTILWLGC
jgi:hypothetical protein